MPSASAGARDGRQLHYEKLDVYWMAIELTATAERAAARLGRGRSYLADQLRRAAASVPANIAEGATANEARS